MSSDLPGLSMHFLSCLGNPRMHVQGEHMPELKTAIEHAYRKSIPQIIRNFSYVIKRKKVQLWKWARFDPLNAFLTWENLFPKVERFIKAFSFWTLLKKRSHSS